VPRYNSSSYTVSVPAGMVLEISVPTDLTNLKGAFPLEANNVIINGKERPLIHGFAVEDPDVGIIEAATNSLDPKIFYRQLQTKENRIYFYTDTGEIQIVSVLSIPIHDHSSISQGGPAFCTYASDFKKIDPTDTGDGSGSGGSGGTGG